MSVDPIDLIDGLPDTSDVSKSELRAELKAVLRRFDSVATVRATDLSDRYAIFVGSYIYTKNTADTTSADDGAAIIHDINSARWYRSGVASNNYLGNYNAGTTYQIGDVVTYNDSSYFCIAAGTLAQTPAKGSAYWQVCGYAGSPGGPITIPYTFSTTTADADPGAGLLRLDNATQNIATTIRADLLDNLGNTWTGVIDTFDGSTSTIKGFVRIQHEFDETKWLLATLSARAAPSGYRNLTIAIVGYSAASPFANLDPLLLEFIRNGDKGDPGNTGATGAGYTATSATSQATVDTGSVVLTTQAGLAYTAGARVRATSTGTAEWMEGVIDSYSGTTLTFTADLKSGSGTNADWNINLAGERGTAGAGDLSSINNLSDVANAATAFGNIKQAATSSATGVVELAIASEVTTGTDDTRAATPKAIKDAGILPGLPQNSKSAAYTTVLADANGHIFHPDADTTARIWTIDSNANVAYPIGTTITFVNGHGAGIITIAITTDTMRLSSAGTTGSRTLAANGIATAIKVTATEWKISGTGLT